MKLEKIIFACCIYSYDCFEMVKKLGNIFFDYEKYYDVLCEVYEQEDNVEEYIYNDYARDRDLDIAKTHEAMKELNYQYNNFEFYLQKYVKEYQKRKIEALFVTYKGDIIDEKYLHEQVNNIITLDVKSDDIKKVDEIINDKSLEEAEKTLDAGIEYFKPEGGFRCGELIVVGARPSVGKTTYALNIMNNLLLRDKKVLFFSSEMKRQKIVRKILSLTANINERLYSRNQLDAEERIQLEKAKERYRQVELYIDDTPNIYIEDLIQKSKMTHKKKDIDFICIDYLGLLSTRKQLPTIRERYNYYSTQLKKLARELDIPVMVLAQLNRQSENKENPSMHDLKESGKLEEDADYVILIKNEQWIDEIQKTSNYNKHIVDKNRNGKMGHVYYTKFERITGYMWDTNYTKI